MPTVRAITAIDDEFSISDHRGGTRRLQAAAIPSQHVTIAAVETYINTVWIPTNFTDDYQVRVHVLSLSPMRVNVKVWDAGLPIPATWWVPLVPGLP